MKYQPLFVFLVFLSCLFMLLLMPGCQDDDDDHENDDYVDVDDDDDDDDDNDDETDPLCPEDQIDLGKQFLAQGKGEAARALFLSVLKDYPKCNDAHFGLALADQLRFFAILDDLLSLLLDPLEEKGTIDISGIVIDYAQNLLEPIVVEILENLEPCIEDESFSFELNWFPLRLLDLEIMVYAGRYDRGDALVQSGEFSMLAAALNTILSVDMGFDFQIIIDHYLSWGSMAMFDIVLDVLDMLLEMLDDPEFPNFLRLREDGAVRMPSAGLQMGHSFQYFHDGIEWVMSEPISQNHDVTGCSDRNKNNICDPTEFIKGIFYSIPYDLNQILQQVDLALRNSYWDGTSLDIYPGEPNPFLLSELNPVLAYLGLPSFLPSLKIDFGKMYSDPDPNGIHNTAKSILTIISWVLELVLQDKSEQFINQAEDWKNGEPGAVPQSLPSAGLETVTNIAALPYPAPTARTMQISSHDPTGGNEDGQFPPNHLYIDEHGEFVLFDQFGPGSIYRIQFTHTWSFIANWRLYVDDMDTPIAEGPFWMLFYLGAFEPFSRPMIENMFTASGTNFIYIPIAFEKRCKITFNVPPEYFGVTFVRYDSDMPVVSFTGNEDYTRLQSQFKNVGLDPKEDVASYTQTGSQLLDAGQQVNFLQILDEGAIWRLYLNFDPFTQETVEDLWLVAHWDGCWTPAVEAPVPEFFGSYFIEDAPKTLMMGHDGDRFYSYFPMPFWENAVLKIENRGTLPVEISWEAVIAEDAYAENAGYFAARYNEANPVPIGEDYQIALNENVVGKWVGLTHTMRGANGGWYMEGDERFYVDGSASPAVHGTGTEDYYNGGWYFIRGPFTHPMCGSPSQQSFSGYSQTGAYRLHLGDAVHYLDKVRLGIEHGGSNSYDGDHYSSVAYFYERSGTWLDQTDYLDIGSAASESSHNYEASQSQMTDPLSSFYEGEDDQIEVTDSGRIVQNESSFTLSIDPENEGIILRRRFDQFNPRQQAQIFVDGVSAGTWYSPENSKTLRWAEEDFPVPASLTAGKAAIEISVKVEGEVLWTEYAYWAFSIVQYEL